MPRKIDNVGTELRSGLEHVVTRVIARTPTLSPADDAILSAIADTLKGQEDVEFTFVRKAGVLVLKCNDIQLKITDPLAPPSDKS